MGNLVRILLLLLVTGGLFFYYTVSQAHKYAIYDEVPSTTEFYKLQYCLEDSDCQLVQWQDCNDCSYSRSLNKRFAQYFHDNADYYNYPIGFNRHYCDALQRISEEARTKTLSDELGLRYSVACENADVGQQPVGSKCDKVLKLCYSLCQDEKGKEHRCDYDRYSRKIYDAYVAPIIDPVGDENEARS